LGALPDSERQRQPSFDHYKCLPILEPGGGRVHLFVGELAGQHSEARTFSPIVGAELKLGANAHMHLPLNPAWEHALVIIEGEVSLDDKQLAPGALHYLGSRHSGIELSSKETARAVLIGGAPFGASIIIWWNFVACSVQEIQAARADWSSIAASVKCTLIEVRGSRRLPLLCGLSPVSDLSSPVRTTTPALIGGQTDIESLNPSRINRPGPVFMPIAPILNEHRMFESANTHQRVVGLVGGGTM